MSPRTPWLLLYIFSNIIGACVMFFTGNLIGDSTGGRVYSDLTLLYVTVMLVVSYFLILVPIFNFMSRIQVKATKLCVSDEILGKRIGIFLFVLQVFYLLFNYISGVNVAGSIEKTDSSFSIFFVLVPVDMLFLIYYGIFRNNKYYGINLLVWVVSNILRGWSGIFLFIFFFEWCRGIRSKRISFFWSSVAVLIILAIYPAIFNIKLAIRSAAGAGFGFSEILNIIITTFIGGNFFSLIVDGIFNLIGRIQIASILIEVVTLRDFLQSEFMSGSFLPFWLEGLHGVILDRIFDIDSISITAKFPEYAGFPGNFQLGEWNTNIGYVGWFFIAPILIPQYILYTFSLAFLSVFLTKKISNEESAMDMLWIAWVVYLLAPWLNIFILFIYALFLFYILKFIFAVDLRLTKSTIKMSKY